MWEIILSILCVAFMIAFVVGIVTVLLMSIEADMYSSEDDEYERRHNDAEN